MIGVLNKVEQEKVELEGPFECVWCKGHMMLDATFIDQVVDGLQCPYCHSEIEIPS